MEIEEETKPIIFNSVNPIIKEKKRYFRVEKKRNNHPDSNIKESKKIFKTQKDKVKTTHEFKKLKSLKANKFITTMNNNSTDKENNSFVVKKIIPKKLKTIKDPKTESKHLNDFWNSRNNILFTDNNIFSNDQKINCFFNPIPNDEEKKINNYNIKLIPVYFCSIKNLCKYINTNFFNTTLTEQKAIDELISQIYQSLQILDRKINDFMNFKNLKDDARVNKEDFDDISSLKENLLFMKNVLNNTMSQNLINIYLDIDNFCKLYS